MSSAPPGPTAPGSPFGPRAVRPLVAAGLALGVGLGGFLDGILLHQVLQWHHMVSTHPDPAVARNLELNVLADGIFHVVTYLVTIAGVALLWRAWRRPGTLRSGRILLGAIVGGWGLFNLADGVVNHHLLGIHHVRVGAPPGGVLAWDIAWLALGALLVVVGWMIAQSDPALAPRESGSPARRLRGA